ncbi:hypothetical protein BFU36_12800 [Sulfolobus sp. A20]|uniref:alcohol dehydrogenase catalytic domain-containing protein n=1 Tax=Sulfolobaceae TaxID=118883 RepID=UPI000845EE56|nr:MULTISPECIES: alcohol dehydrogenase catalytic domain-containing protein [unclassified Sulfolobus]TRM76188.1 alcohol dehydrogenase [Sulfolobus sp. A20-N-F8]TRM79077.1 alcohol dehydrogenase [Sulfolobus sp. B5]TRM81742.1 alcohol dehydrogenase [Sulfolobus sp. D5]TRM83270.1 alcohol dehydrogenase [Sulfolobus sp. A20-N-F6]TRM85279.1 alcohol dehydrogenase [Sulfolobus sp. F3]TRN01799.1 alcohol dehydrogenase [Sulfolobus sp. F1]TRN01885.1 alcohol dehydrogenase [Sulfolobus sp. E1]
MKALVYHGPGVENLRLEEVKTPEPNSHEVLVKVKLAGITNLEYLIVNNLPYSLFTLKSPPPLTPMPHILGIEFSGFVERVGDHVKGIREGDRVAVYEVLFDGTCDMCSQGSTQICRKVGHIGINSNGGYAEYTIVPETNVFPIPDDMDWGLATSLSHSVTTAYHALNKANVKLGDTVVVFGASGNVGMFAVQFAKMLGANVVAVTRDPQNKEWLKEFGADYVVRPDEVVELVKKTTNGRMAEVSINPLGVDVWDKSIEVLGPNGKLVFFGGYKSLQVTLGPLPLIYGREISLISTRIGSLHEFKQVIKYYKKLKVKTWKIYELESANEAFKEVLDKNGKQFIKIS